MAQDSKIVIVLDNGEVLYYDRAAVEKITFIDDTIIPYQSLIKVRSKDSLLLSFPTGSIDSIKVDKNLDSLLLYSLFAKTPSDVYYISSVDSISFSLVHNDNVMSLPYKYGNNDIGDFHTSLWYDNKIYVSKPVRYFMLEDDLSIAFDSTLFAFYGPLFMSLNQEGTRLLSVGSFYPDVSTGWLIEDDLKTGIRKVLDSSRYISSAMYVSGDDIIYYTYGGYSDVDKTPDDAGYYLYERANGKRTLLLHHISEIGPSEVVNGFDISQDGTKLVIPVVRQGKQPSIVEYNFETHEADTLSIEFDISRNRYALWLRYNKDGSKILYSNYPIYSFAQGAVNDDSEVGIIDRTNETKRVLYLNPQTEGYWINVFPEWSHDEEKIIFGSAPLLDEPPGYAGRYRVYILKELP